jgi:hypothetical protein
MQTFKNKNFKKRNYDCTNVVFCQADTAPDNNWVPCNESQIETLKCTQLYIMNDVRYFGYL